MKREAYFSRRVDIQCGKYPLKLGTRTFIMGIINVTPDSFSDGGDFIDVERAVGQGLRMMDEGVDIIDIGGESTRPGSAEVGAEEELRRIIPVIEQFVKKVPVPISIDTYKAEVAEAALKKGVHMINDVWGLQRDPQMAEVIAKYDVPVVAMHNQVGTFYQGDIMEEIIRFLEKSISIAKAAGIRDEHIILDPGIGFGKTPEQNIVVLARLEELNKLGYPFLLGTSRKSMIGKILDLPPKERVEGTISTSVIGVMKGADILRVHDVKENRRAVLVADAIIRGTEPWIK